MIDEVQKSTGTRKKKLLRCKGWPQHTASLRTTLLRLNDHKKEAQTANINNKRPHPQPPLRPSKKEKKKKSAIFIFKKAHTSIKLTSHWSHPNQQFTFFSLSPFKKKEEKHVYMKAVKVHAYLKGPSHSYSSLSNGSLDRRTLAVEEYLPRCGL